MSKKQKNYGILLDDLYKGAVSGLEESYLEHKLASGKFTNENLKSIISEVEKAYQVKFRKVLSHFEPSSIQ